MSYDITFKVRVQDSNVQIPIGDCQANITWNVRDIITKSTGLQWINQADNGLCVDVIPKIIHGLQQLVMHPDKYRQYEPSSGYGTVEGTQRFFMKVINDWKTTADTYPQIADKIRFWIW